MTQVYFLAQSAFFCDLGDGMIFLDTLLDRYYLIERNQRAWLSEIQTAPKSELSHKASQFAVHLTALGLLTLNTESSKLLVPTPAVAPHSSLPIEQDKYFAFSIVPELAAFFRAVVNARSARKKFALLPLLDKARCWRQAPERPRRNKSPHLSELVGRFLAMEPLAYGVHDTCFFRSLVLLRYLSFFGISTDWVFGVRLRPFHAHCWLEKDGVVLNDTIETIQSYSRIMCA